MKADSVDRMIKNVRRAAELYERALLLNCICEIDSNQCAKCKVLSQARNLMEGEIGDYEHA